MNQLQETLDELKDKKMPTYTMFSLGHRTHNKLTTAENMFWVKPLNTGVAELGERLRQYGRFSSHLAPVSQLLKELSEAFEGKTNE